MDENQFSKVVAEELTFLYHYLDEKSEEWDLDIDFSDDVIYIHTSEDKNMVINRHTPTKQIWLSSPFSGADYFFFDANNNQWVNKEGNVLRDKVKYELEYR
jgi:iron donor protein CyaY